MTRRNVAIFLVLLLGTLAIIWWQPSSGWYLYDILARRGTEREALIQENQSLREALFSFTADNAPRLPEREYRIASVYGRMPGIAKGKFAIAFGAREGAQIGQGVYLASETVPHVPILVGKIEAVYGNISRVTTVFDAEWESAVHIGPKKKEALLVGGNFPRLTLIEKEDGGVKEGDAVRNASPDFRYGTFIGEAANVGLTNDRLREEAELKFGYALGNIRTVYIHVAFEGILNNYAP